MIKLIPARIENGHVVPGAPLPPSEQVRSVTILCEVIEPPPPTGTRDTLSRLLGIIKDPGDWKEDYSRYVEEKYR